MINDARARPPVDEDAEASPTDERGPDRTDAEGAAAEPDEGTTDELSEPARTGRRTKAARTKEAARPSDDEADDRGADDEEPRRRLSIPLLPVLALLLVLLLGGCAFLWFTREEPSGVTTEDYTEVLQMARSNVVDFTSFDHLTLDDDIEQVRRVAVGDLRDEAVQQLDGRRQEITDAEAIVSTEVIAAGVTRADAEDATVLLVIQTTRETNASQQAEVVKYRIEVEMQKVDGRWVLSRITGA